MSKILFCACNSWENHAHVGSHHLAKGFARQGWQVAFISDPVSPAHLFSGVSDELNARVRLWASGGKWVAPHIFTWVPATLCAPHNKPLLRSDWVARNWQCVALPSLYSTLRRAGFDAVDLVYVDSPTQAYWWRNIPHKKSFLRVADAISGFAKHTHAAQSAIEELARAVDVVGYTSPFLHDAVAALQPRQTLFLPNGVDVEHFSCVAPLPPEYQGDPRPVIVYVGAMEAWFHTDWVRQAAAALPECRFVLIGSDKHVRRVLAPVENVDLLGPRPFAELPGYLQHAAVGMIPFDVASHPQLVHTINPLKLYEYMAAGLPVVASRWRGLEALASPALLADSAGDFVAALRTALEQRAVLGLEGKHFVTPFDWNQRVHTLLDSMGFA